MARGSIGIIELLVELQSVGCTVAVLHHRDKPRACISKRAEHRNPA